MRSTLSRIFIVTLILATCNTLPAQFALPRAIVGIGSQLDITAPRLFDIEADGDTDVIASYKDPDGQWLCVLENIDSAYFLAPRHLVQCEGYVKEIGIADLDGDGERDLVVLRTNGISWSRKAGAVFDTLDLLFQSLANIDHVFCDDLDNDGDIDLTYFVQDIGVIGWLKNDGFGNFSEQIPLVNIQYQLRQIIVDDIDGDSDTDIIYSGGDPALYCLRNQGSGDFIPETIITLDDVPSCMDIGDVDQNGLPDIAVVQDGSSQHLLLYLQNADHVFGDPLGVSQWTGYAESLTIADLDSDGDKDLLLSYASTQDSLSWIRNNGDNSFAGSQLIHNRVGGHATVVDINGDGTQDIFIGRYFLIQSYGIFLEVVDLTCDAGRALSMVQADMDADGDPDLVACSFGQLADRVYWMENSGDGNFRKQHVIDFFSIAASSVNVADLDGDQDLDVVIAQGTWQAALIWYENDGHGNFPLTHPIPNDLGFNSAGLLATNDIDQDGDIDVVISTLISPYKIIWSANDGAGIFTPMGTLQPLHPNHLEFSDLDGDSLPDLILGGYAPTTIAWKRNLGAGEFGPLTTIVSDQVTPSSISSVDMDLDGDNDLLFTADPNDTVFWCENEGGANFSDPIAIDANASNAHYAIACDVDADSDLDVITASTDTDYLLWEENLGNMSFAPHHVISQTYAYYVPTKPILLASDLDADGDSEIVLGQYQLNDIVVYDNQSGGQYNASGHIFIDLDQDGAIGPGEPPAAYVPVHVQPYGSTCFTNDDGAYTTSIASGEYSISSPLNPPLWSLTTDSSVYHFSLSTQQADVTGLDFGYKAAIDTSIVLPTIISAPTEYDAVINQWLTYTNMGTRIEHGLLHLRADTLISFVDFVPSPDSVVGHDVYWSFDTLEYFEQRRITLTVHIPPIQFLWDTLVSDLWVTTFDTLNAPVDTFSTRWQGPVIYASSDCSKEVAPAGFGPLGAVDVQTDHLDYTICFQNRGTDVAQNVTITDPLDHNIDARSLIILGSSHPISSTSVAPDGELTIHMDNIMLPDSGTDQVRSHGAVQLRLGLEPGLVSGTALHNTAYLSLDQRRPLATNTTTTTLRDCSLMNVEIIDLGSGELMASYGIFFQWYFNGDSIAGAQSSILLANDPGFYSVSVSDALGCSLTSEPFHLIDNSMAHVTTTGSVLAPNPAIQETTLFTTSPVNADDIVRVIDLNGAVSLTIRACCGNQVDIPRHGLPSGLYVVQLLRANGLTESHLVNFVDF